MYIKIHKSCRDVVAICDSELIGKKFEEGKFQLDVKENFFKGNKKSKEETLEIMQDMSAEDATFNIVGEESIKAALECNLITKESIGKIAGIKFAMVLI